MDRYIMLLQLLTNLVLVAALLRATFRLAALKSERAALEAESQRVAAPPLVEEVPRGPSPAEVRERLDAESVQFEHSLRALCGRVLPRSCDESESYGSPAGQVNVALLRALS